MTDALLPRLPQGRSPATSNDPSSRFTLRDLPMAARLTLAVFLISVGVGYLSALIQLHFQHAQPGSLLPTGNDAVRMFHGHVGDKPPTRFHVLLEADEKLPFNGGGQMSAAFTTRSAGWKGAIKAKAKEMVKGRGRGADLDLQAAEGALRAERDTERLIILAWILDGASKQEYDKDEFCIPESLANRPLTVDFKTDAERPTAKIASIFKERCVRCHIKDGDDAKAADFPLDTYAKIKPYVSVTTSTAMSLPKLAQTTHVHLLGFSMLYMLTGLIFAFTSFPAFIRVPIAPLPLFAQVIDISLWWLARLDAPLGPQLAMLIPITGAIVASSLGIQILTTLADLFGWKGKIVLVLLLGGAVFGAYVAKTEVIDPHLTREKAPAVGVE